MNRNLVLGFGLAAGLAGSGQALAQQASPPPPPANGGTAVDEVIVTAQKRNERLQDVPIAVAAEDAKTLNDLGVTDAQTLGSLTPGLIINRVASAAIITLRGIGNQNAATLGDEGATVLYVDGVYLPGSQGAVFKFNNIERTEVLKGPQGTLFGRNATGGVVQLITKTPSQTAHVDVDAGYGNYNTFTGNFYGTTPLGEKLSADLAVHYEDQADGWGKNLFTGKDVFTENDFGIRSKWLLDLGDTKFTLSGDYNRSRDDQGTAYTLYPGSTGVDGQTGPVGGAYDVSLNYPSQSTNVIYGGSFTIDHDLQWAHLVSISAYHRVKADNYLDQDGTFLPVANALLNERERTFSQELQLVSEGNHRINWLAGFYYYNDKSGYAPVELSGLAFDPLVLDINSVQDTQSYAGFGQATATLIEGTHLTLGGRYTIDDKQVNGEIDTNIPGLVLGKGDQSATFRKFTYRIALDHNFTPDILGYLSYNRGFKSGGFNAISPSAPAFNPEVLDAYEAGLKTELFDRSMRLNLAAFYYKFNNLQLLKIVAGSASTVNAASAEVKGFDADLEAHPVQNLTIIGGFSYLDSTFTSYPNAPFNVPSPTGGNLTVVGDATGNSLPYAPEVSFNIGGEYAIPTQHGRFAVNVNFSYTDHVFVNADNLVRLPTYKLLNASITWTSPDAVWDARLWGRNLTNAHYYSYVTEQALGNTASPSAPLTFGFTIGYHWGG